MIENNNRKIKFLFIGAEAVGKTSIIKQFLSNNLSNGCDSTIGTNMNSVNLVLLDENCDLIFYEIRISDLYIPLENKINESIIQYLENYDIIIFVYDITDIDSLNYITKFWGHIDEKFMQKNLVKIVVGNKTDLNKKEYDEYNEIIEFGKNFSTHIKGTHFPISALNKDNVNNLIKVSATKFLISEKNDKNFNKNIQKKEIVTIVNEDGNKNEYEYETEKCKCLCRCY